MPVLNSPEKPKKEVKGVHVQVTEFVRVIGEPKSLRRVGTQHATVYDETAIGAMGKIIAALGSKRKK